MSDIYGPLLQTATINAKRAAIQFVKAFHLPCNTLPCIRLGAPVSHGPALAFDTGGVTEVRDDPSSLRVT